ncbi:MAG TPA: glycosyltransferase [Candidatus Acidoferrales bacterium]|nr:glycosyltransferase [Candidatus Acidoferrales bacterium]
MDHRGHSHHGFPHLPAFALQHALDRPTGGGQTGSGRPQLTRGAGPPATILILFSDTGGGHRAAAQALRQALLEIDPSLRIELLDPLIGQGPALVRQLAQLYPAIINRSRVAWGMLYRSSNTRAGFAAARSLFGRQVKNNLIEDLLQVDPDLVISVHPLLNHVAHRAIRSSGRTRAQVTVVTDLVDLHRGWACPQVDLVVVPTHEARDQMIQRRVPSARVALLGMPVGLGFRPPGPGEKGSLRRQLGLDEQIPTILVAGGGEGAGRILTQVRELAGDVHPWQLIVVCGRNRRLRERLQGLELGTRPLINGFVDNMAELMRASDVVVTKAGPGAICEALASGLPLLLTGYLPGQETANVGFVTSSGAGIYVPRSGQLRSALEGMLQDRGAALERMVEKTAGMVRAGAALDIARRCLDLALAQRASGQTIR